MNLLQKQSKRDFIIATLEENYGEEFNNEVEQIEQLRQSIKQDVETYGLMIVEKDFEAKMNRMKEFKKEIDNQIKYLEAEKVKIKYQLAEYLEENGSQPIETPSGTKYLKVGYTKKRNIDQDEVEEKFRKYNLTVDNELMEKIIGDKGILNSKRKDTILADLPDNHPAISIQLNPQIKLNAKP